MCVCMWHNCVFLAELCTHSKVQNFRPAASAVGLTVLGGSWLDINVISRAISKVTILVTHIQGLLTPLITTHEPPRMAFWS